MREGSLQGRRYVVLAVMASMAMISVEATIVSTAMPGIAAQFGDLTLYSWVFSSFLLAQTAMTVVFGKLAEDRRTRTAGDQKRLVSQACAVPCMPDVNAPREVSRGKRLARPRQSRRTACRTARPLEGNQNKKPRRKLRRGFCRTIRQPLNAFRWPSPDAASRR